MYLTKSRPDILCATSFASTKSQNPTEYDYEHLLQIVDYLYNTQDTGLILSSSNSNNSSISISIKMLCRCIIIFNS